MRRNKTFFSIIIPVFNAEKYLNRCFDSIRNQAFPDYEVLLINDGSTDNSHGLCKEYAESDTRVKYFHQDNHGVSSARNQGLQAASGQFVCFLDADDEYDSTYLSTFYELITQYQDIDLFCCGYLSVRGEEIKEVKYPGDNEAVVLDRNRSMQLYELILLQSLWNKVFRKQIIDDYALRLNENISLGEDLLFNLSYLDKSNDKIYILNKTLYRYYLDAPDSLNKRYRPDLYDTFAVISDQMGEYFNRWSLDEEQMTKYYNAVYSMMVNSMRNTFRLANTAAYHDKILFNNEILKSDRFKKAVRCSKGVMHPIYRLAYGLNDYRIIRVLDKLYAKYVKYVKNR